MKTQTKTKKYYRKWCSFCEKYTTGEYKFIVELFICGECKRNNYISYGCECGYPTVEYNQYQVINEKLIELDIEEIINENNKKYFTAISVLENKKIYPECSGHTYWEGSESWNEIHYCPKCKKEFSFTNGT